MTIYQRSQIIDIVIYKCNNRYICRFMFFDNAYMKTSAHRIVILIFEHALTLLLTIINHICDLSSIISFYIIFLVCF